MKTKTLKFVELGHTYYGPAFPTETTNGLSKIEFISAMMLAANPLMETRTCVEWAHAIIDECEKEVMSLERQRRRIAAEEDACAPPEPTSS